MSSVASAGRRQIRRLTRHLSRSLLVTMAVAAAIAIAVVAIGLLLTGNFLSDVNLSDAAGVDTVWLGAPAIAVVIVSFVHQIVAGANFTRVPIANGATRRNLTIAHLLNAAIGAVVIVAVVLLIYGLELRFGPQLLVALLEEYGTGPVGLAWKAAMIAIGSFALLVSGLALGIVFLRFHWAVGVSVLVTFLWIMPGLELWLGWTFWAWFRSLQLIPLILNALLMVAAYALMMRRIQVP